MRRAVIYTRISRDQAGEGRGVARQERDCRALVNRNGWDLVEVCSDNDISAFTGVRRPGYTEACQLVRDGAADVIVAWHPDRLHRSPRELEDFIGLLDETGATVATCTAGDYDLSTPDGRLMARIVGSVARKESEDKSRRIRAWHVDRASRGEHVGGRSFGLDRGVVVEAEADLIREACARVLAGEGTASIVADWDARGVPTIRGAKWSTTALRTVLSAPRIAGLRVYQGEVIGPASWPAIVDRGTWERVRARVTAKRRERPARSYLLSGGLIVCGSCGARMVAAPRKPRRRPLPSGELTARGYGCVVQWGGCGGTFVMADPVEELVVAQVIEVVGRLGAPPDRDDSVLLDQLGRDEDRLREYAAMLDAGELSRVEWAELRGRVLARIEGTQARLAESSAPWVGLDTGDLAGVWDGLPLGRRRAIVERVVGRVVIAGRGRGGPRVDLGRVSVEWRV